MADLLKVLGELAKSKVSDLHVFPEETCFIRRAGALEPLSNVKFSEDEVKKIILSTSNPKVRELLGKHRQTNYSFVSPTGERFRFSVFNERGKFALAIRTIPAYPAKLTDLGLPEPIKKVLSKPSGLIIVGSPAGNGKTTTIASLLDFINTHYEKNILTVENPVEIKFKDDKSSFIQREIPLDVANVFDGLDEAYRMDPDVIMTDSLGYKDAMEQAFFLCEAGCLVIGATDGGNSQQILERIIGGVPDEERDGIKGKLATHLAMIISQRLVPRMDGFDRVPIFDILVNTPQVKSLIRTENLIMIRPLQEQDLANGMCTFDRQLLALAKKAQIYHADSIAYAEDSQEMALRLTKK